MLSEEELQQITEEQIRDIKEVLKNSCSTLSIREFLDLHWQLNSLVGEYRNLLPEK